MSNITIRPAASTDLDRITDIYADAVTHGTASYELEPPDRAEMGERFDSLITGGFPYLVAEKDGIVLGYAYAGPFRPRPAYRFIVEDSVYVAPEAKGHGIGLKLMQG
ncbi:MAG: N-acetyltransferase, partial [Mesorhizobium sp.]